MHQVRMPGWFVLALGLVIGCLLTTVLVTPRVAQAQVPDSGAQRAEMIRELKARHRETRVVCRPNVEASRRSRLRATFWKGRR